MMLTNNIKKKKIIIIHWSRNNFMTTDVIEMINFLSNKNYRINLITQIDEEFKKQISKQVIIYNSPLFKNKLLINYMIYIIFTFYMLCNILEKENIKIIHCINVGGSIPIIIYNLFFSCHISYNIRAPNVEFYHRYLLFLHKNMFDISEKVYLISEEYKKMINNTQNYDMNKIEVLSDGVNFEKFDPSIFNLKIYNKIGVKMSDRIIIYIGSLDKNRRLDIIINAFNKVAKEYHNAKLLIIGMGNDLINLKNIIKINNIDNIIFTGQIPYYEIPKYISISEIALSPISDNYYYSLSSPLKTFEYMAMSKPTIASDILPHRELISNGENGILVKWYDSDMYYKSIKYLLENKELSIQMGKKGRALIEKKYDYKKIFKKLEEYFDSIRYVLSV